MKGGSECVLTDQHYRLEQWSNVTPSLRRTYRDNINLVPKSCQVFSSVMYCVRWESGQETSWSQTLIGELEEVDASEIHARRLNAKEVLSPMKGDNFYFPSRRWNSQNPWRKSASETIHFHQGSSWTWRGTRSFFRGESDGLSSPNPLRDDSTREDAEAKNVFWSITGDFIYRHLVEPRVKLYMPKEESFPIPLKYIDVTVTTHTSLDVLLEKHIDDYWNVDGVRELSDAWTGFTRFIFIERKATWRIFMVRERLTRKQTTYGHMCGSICLMQRKVKQSKNGLSRNRSSIMPEDFTHHDKRS